MSPPGSDDGDGAAVLVLRPQALILAFLGDYIHPHRVSVYAGSMIDVFGRVGVSEPATRSMLARMAGRGLLRRHRRGRRTYYGVTPRTSQLLLDGLDRVYRVGAVNDTWDGHWTLLAFTVPDAWQRQRNDLRSQLVWAGFGPLQGGLWVAPGTPAVEPIVTGLDHGRVRVFRARADALTDVDQMVADAYDLEALARRYRAFHDRWDGFSPDRPPPGWRGHLPSDPLAARLRLAAEWLQIIRRDPHLPVQHLPAEWPAATAQETFRVLWTELAEVATRIAGEVLDCVPEPCAVPN